MDFLSPFKLFLHVPPVLGQPSENLPAMVREMVEFRPYRRPIRKGETGELPGIALACTVGSGHPG